MDRQRQTDRLIDKQTQKAKLTQHYSYGKYIHQKYLTYLTSKYNHTTRMWANAQPGGRPAEHRWRPLLNAAKFG